MGLNNQIGGSVDVLAPTTMDEAYEKAVRKEQKLRNDNSIRDKSRKKSNWGQSSRKFNKKGDRYGVNNKNNKRHQGGQQNNHREGKSFDKPIRDYGGNSSKSEKKGPPGGCFNWVGNHYANQYPTKPPGGQHQRNPLPPQQAVFEQRIHAVVDNRQVEYQFTPVETLGTLYGIPINILIDTGATENFILPKLLSRFPRRASFMVNSWTVEYANQSRAKVEKYLFGARVEFPNFTSEVDLSHSTVRVGVSGIGSVGKTTFAKVVYNRIYARFDAYFFAQKNSTLVDLQRAILRRLVNYHGEASSVAEGKALMENLLQGVRALVILDDVNDRSHLDEVNGDWFGPGNRIIITSRNRHILNLAEVDSALKMTGLGEYDALQLFCWHAFSRPFAKTPYKNISTRIARACWGHPLSLQVIGAHLFDKKEQDDIQCWEEALHNIGKNQEISGVLRISYDGLSHVEKEIFLDIACCFAGERKHDAVIFWEVLYPNRVQTALKNLMLKMLINYSGTPDLLNMHDLLREMGRGIQEQVGNNSRLWLPTGVHRTLSRDRAEGVNMLVYTGQNGREPLSLHKMPSLRYLVVQNTKVVGNIGNLAPNLLWIKIRNCELNDTYTWLRLRNTFQLDSSWSQVRILSIEQCASLTRIPNTLDSLVNLRCLYLENCVALTTLPNTFGNLSQLKELHVRNCTNLTSLPDTVGNLMQLEMLELRACTVLRSLPSTLGNLARLRKLRLKYCTGLRYLPNTIGDLAQLQHLSMRGCSDLQSLRYPLGKLQNLKRLHLSDWKDLQSFHDGVVKLAQLRELNRRVGIGSLVQKKFNVYFIYHAPDEREISMYYYKYKYLRTGSLRICPCSEDEESSDIREAIDSSDIDILVPVYSKTFLQSNICMRKYVAIRRSNALVIPMCQCIFTWYYFIQRLNTLRESECQSF
ncbi:disease resistance protein RUN1-like [Cryptomeria japonica]|uniref:disease resistance protein RUN1-like n=1 Tax=Cryptomeria japonica TaxID=3369 RepID=UPI0027DA4232|nr:disease resistance protein RUN1-like [Cryptomeria japonica]